MPEALFSKPHAARAGTHLLLMLHGYGSSETAMARHFGTLPPNVTGVALRGGLDVGGASGWFLLDYFLAHDFADVVASAQSVLDFQDAHAEAFESVNLFGYSQGMAMATTLMRLRPGAYRSAVGLSGFVLDSKLLELIDPEPGGPVGRTPFFWGRDRADPVINADAVEHTAGWLQRHTRLTARTYPGMGHATSADELRDAAAFLRHYLPREGV
ncbi:alpha/beta hydrolase [Arthrobacter sp. KK5.5]|uniref:alpha/beta hydrolase n=1 Tax=Arthrobacter sp. KK5.5 TaxID=3373084 RepID=UPI003EE7798D